MNFRAGGLLSRLKRAKDALAGAGRRVEKRMREGNDVGGRVEPPRYETDADESLAMALGKDVGSVHGADGLADGLADGVADELGRALGDV